MEIQITVNGNRCKQYNHAGRTYVQANPGSEYVIEVKNNHWKRVLAVGSVDGLNILTGKTANEADSGYIIGAYSSEKIKGFRFSDDEWALFKFGYKFNGNTYAQSKEDGSEKNCGVIGVRFFYEKDPIVTTYTVINNGWPNYCYTGAISPQIYNCSAGGTSYSSNVNYQASNLGTQDLTYGSTNNTYGSTNNTFKDVSQQKMSKKRSAGGGCSAGDTKGITANYCASAPLGHLDNSLDFCASAVAPIVDFDMGTCWGKSERSKVKTVSFERGCLAQSFDIYYASRESLIKMGVPIETGLSINLPQSFPDNGLAFRGPGKSPPLHGIRPFRTIRQSAAQEDSWRKKFAANRISSSRRCVRLVGHATRRLPHGNASQASHRKLRARASHAITPPWPSAATGCRWL